MSQDSYKLYIEILNAIVEAKRNTASQANISQRNADRLLRAVTNFRVSLLRDIGVSEGRKSES